MGYYFSKISASIEDLGDNKVNIIYDIDLGNKAKNIQNYFHWE